MKFLIVGDAPNSVESVILRLKIRYTDATFLSASDSEAGLELVRMENPDLVILDVRLPGPGGFKICRQIRSNSQVPIIMLTVCNRVVDVVRGLSVGADDYITKPFSHGEFLARVAAVLRRARHDENGAQGLFKAGRSVGKL